MLASYNLFELYTNYAEFHKVYIEKKCELCGKYS